MILFYSIFLHGWGLTRQMWTVEGQYPPKPSISVNPSNVVAVGGDISIRCKEEQNGKLNFSLFKEISAHMERRMTVETNSREVVFRIDRAQKSDKGIYRCLFYYGPNKEASYYSDPVEISVREQTHLSPSISVIPSDKVFLGEKITIQCSHQYDRYAEFSLIKEGDLTRPATKRVEKKVAEFYIYSAQKSDGGIYFCDYHFNNEERYSYFSNRVHISIIDRSLMKPLIQVEPKKEPILGGSVRIHCQGPEKNLNFSLYKSKDLIASQSTEGDSSMATFPIFRVREESTGNYSCCYHLRGTPFVWSELSDPMELVVKAGFSTMIWSIITAGLLLLVLLLVLLLILYRKRRKDFTAKEVPTIMQLTEPAVGESLDEVSYAAINHSSLKNRQTAQPDTGPESCVYAAVSIKKN